MDRYLGTVILTQIPFGVGSLVKVHSVFGGYPLPPGLDENEPVTVLTGHGSGYYMVKAARGEFNVFLTNIDSGWFRRTSFSEKLPWD